MRAKPMRLILSWLFCWRRAPKSRLGTLEAEAIALNFSRPFLYCPRRCFDGAFEQAWVCGSRYQRA